MKFYVKAIAIIASVSVPSVLMAQKTDPGFVPFSTGMKAFKEVTAQNLKLLPRPTAVAGLKPSFIQHLPSIIPDEKRKPLIDHSQTDPVYYFNMPIIKPGNTSKILIAELDPHSPYSYNMPVKKNGVTGK